MGNFGKTPFIHQILLCLVLLFQTGLGDTDLILNGKFLENSCQSITQDYSGCQSEDALNNWSGKFISNGSVAPISVQNTTRFQTFPTTTTGITNVVPLDTQNGNYIRTCIYQSLSTQMDPGAYTLRWAAATRNNILDPEIFSQFHY